MIVSRPAFGPPCGSAGDRRVEEPQAALGQPGADRLRGGGRDRRHVRDERAGGRRAGGAVVGPSSTASTSGPSTTIVITSSRRAGRGRRRPGDGGARVLVAQASAVAAVRFQTVTSWPAARRFAAIRDPMIPRPRKAMRMRRSYAAPGGGPSPPPPGVSIRRRSPGRRLARALGPESSPLSRLRPRAPSRAAARAARRVPAALGDQRQLHRRERLDLARDPVPAAVGARARPSRAGSRTRRPAAGTRAPAPRPACSACSTSRRARPDGPSASGQAP